MLTAVLVLTVLAGSDSVTGHIRDAVSGVGLAGARVGVVGTGLEAVSGGAGQYALGRPAGSGRLRFTLVGYQPLEVEVSGGGTLRVDVALQRFPQPLPAIEVVGRFGPAVPMSGNSLDW